MRSVSIGDFHGTTGPEANHVLPDVFAPAHVVSEVYAFQSYFDSTLLEKALLTQSSNEPIVSSTVKESQVPGYAVGLHPSSQTPIAIQFRTGGQQGGSAPVILKPGQVIRPHGQPAKGRPGSFSGFRYGLPYGWLGGGHAALVIFTTPDADVKWSETTEVIFHRARYAVKQPGDLTAAGSFNNAAKNWPMRFPWTQGLRGADSVPQKGKAVVSIAEPTKVAMVLRQAAPPLAANAAMRVLFQGTNDFGLDSAGSIITTEPPFVDITWPGWANYGTSGNLSTQAPLKIFTAVDALVRLAADDGGVCFVDISGATSFDGSYVDVVRYGRL